MEPWPAWWDFEVEISSHVIDRMTDRGFAEVNLRAMLDDAVRYRASVVPGRFVVTTTWESANWEVVVEPDDLEQLLVVVTAYQVE